MRIKLLALLVMLTFLLTGCGYMLVEDAPVQVGSSIVQDKG